MSKKIPYSAPLGANNTLSVKAFRWVVVPLVGAVFAAGAMAVLTGFLPEDGSHASAAGQAMALTGQKNNTANAAAINSDLDTRLARLTTRSAKSERVAAEPAATPDRPLQALDKPQLKSRWAETFTPPNAAFATDMALKARFARVVADAALSHDKLAAAFAGRDVMVADAGAIPAAKLAGPATERFGTPTIVVNGLPSVALAYADPSPTAAAGALAALSTGEAADDQPLSEDDAQDDTASLPDFNDTPDNSPVPLRRPRADAAVEPKADVKQTERETKRVEREAKRTERPAQQKLAYAKPDDPNDKPSGGLLKNLFRPRAGNGVAVYDISAAKVYMPDGSVLEAHSGIGKMADNPRYANVKMTGPTPPHTYNLKMREKRFHGVEAIRMLPVDGRNKHGRDGFLTHSYLLRGGRAESHGCVAFKDYKRFLSAFKQGKIKQLVVVPGGGKAVVVAKNGRDA